MPIHFTVCPSTRLVAYSVEGPVTPEDAREFLQAIVGHSHFRRGYSVLGDAGGTDCEPDAAFDHALARAVRALSHLLGPCRWAVVVPSEVGRGMVRMWSSLTRGTEVRAAPFATRGAAAQWLQAGMGERAVLNGR